MTDAPPPPPEPSDHEGDLWDHRTLVFTQRAKLIELTNQYQIQGPDGADLGRVEQVGQTGLRKALRAVSNLDSMLPIHLVVTDAAGRTAVQLERGFTWWRSNLSVAGPDGGRIGSIRQTNLFGKRRFELTTNGALAGRILAENWRAWDFRVEDDAEQEIARINKKWGGLAKEFFTTADSYALQIHTELSRPVHALVLAAAVAIDTALKQNEG